MVMVGATGAGLMVRLRGRVLWRPSLPVTRAEKPKVPGAEGVPVKTPVAARARPAGSDPEAMDQVYGVCPPEAWRVTL